MKRWPSPREFGTCLAWLWFAFSLALIFFIDYESPSYTRYSAMGALLALGIGYGYRRYFDYRTERASRILAK